MRILMVGDVVGSPGRDAVKAIVPILVAKHDIDFTVVNCENIANGAGVTPKTADELLAAGGVDMLTSGQHIWRYKEIGEYMDRETRLLKPANYPKGTPGVGYSTYTARNGTKVGVLNLLGRVFMGLDALDNPFEIAKEALEKLQKEAKIILVDVHGEATSEKIVLGWFLDGKVSAVVGTHTHVQTADERILPKGTAYLTDLGMTGPHDSVLGRKVEPVLHKFLTGMPGRFDVADGNVQLCGALIDVDPETGKATSITRVREQFS